ncbi:MAG: DUF4065 domain-containing protein [Bryobacterales bacterium]|nr:DUF4065 domain-containing protein [Bryobacterales bacterium]
MQAPYSPKTIANYFLERRKDPKIKPVTQMKLHKLVYFSHGWYLAFTGDPLINEMVEAWEYGPVVPTLYHEFKEFGSREIKRLATDWDPITEEYYDAPKIPSKDVLTIRLLKNMFTLYGGMSAIEMSALTHTKDSPWDLTRKENEGIRFVDIPNDRIRDYFASKLMDSREAQRS